MVVYLSVRNVGFYVILSSIEGIGPLSVTFSTDFSHHDLDVSLFYSNYNPPSTKAKTNISFALHLSFKVSPLAMKIRHLNLENNSAF